ncbi:MAG TPA: hypothetical protein VGF23_01915 [Gaiellaceae bacterium]
MSETQTEQKSGLAGALGPLSGALGGLESTTKGALAEVKPTGATLSSTGIARATDGLQGADFSALNGPISAIVSQASKLGLDLPVPTDLIAPLTTGLGAVERLMSGGTQAALVSVRGAFVADGSATGFATISRPLRAVGTIAADPAVGGLLDLAAGVVPGGRTFEQQVLAVGRQATSAAAFVDLAGGLLLTGNESNGLLLAAGSLRDSIAAPAATAALDEVRTRGAAALAALEGADPTRTVGTAAVRNFFDAVDTSVVLLEAGLGAAEAGLGSVDVAGYAATLAQARGQLVETALAEVQALAVATRRRLDPILAFDPGVPAASVTAFRDEIVARVDRVAKWIDALDPARLAAPVTGGLATVLAPLHELERLVNEAQAAIHGGMETVRGAIQSLDVQPAIDAIQSVLAPIDQAIELLKQLVEDAQEAIRDAAQFVIKALEDLQGKLQQAADTITSAFGTVRDTILDLHLERIEEELGAQLQPLVTLLEAAHPKPYLDAANTVIDGTATAVGAVPISMLPDSLVTQLRSAAAPIKTIDFDSSVRTPLVTAVDTALKTLDEGIAMVQQAYEQAVALLRELDPKGRVTALEQEYYDPLLAQVKALDPAAILKPATDALEQVRATIQSFDIRKQVLDPLDGAFDQLKAGFDELRPDKLLAPVEDRLVALKKQVVDTLGVATWHELLAKVDPFVAQQLARVDLAALFAQLDAAWDELADDVASAGQWLLESIAALLSRAGVDVSADALALLRRWLVAGENAAAAVTAGLDGAAAALEAARDALAGLDLRAVAGELQTTYRQLGARVDELPHDSNLYGSLHPLAASPGPAETLGRLAGDRDRVLDQMTQAAKLVRALATAGRSEVDVIAAGLRNALRPLTEIPDLLRALLARAGLDVKGRGLRDLVLQLFAAFRPSKLLAPLKPAIDGLKAKLAALVHDGFVAPLDGAITDLERALAAIDLKLVIADLQGIHDDIGAKLTPFRPSTLLGPHVDKLDELKKMVVEFDPLGPVRDVLDRLQAIVLELGETYRPSNLLTPLFEAYDAIVSAAGALDVRRLLKPITDALAEIEQQLDVGLGETGASFARLQTALP